MLPSNNGLKRVSFWKRIHDKAHTPVFGADQLPPTLGRIPLQINDQGTSSFCTAFATSEAGGFLNGVPMAPEWQTASEGQEAGAPIFSGTDPHTALDAALKRGFLPSKDCIYLFAQNGFQDPAIWANYSPSLDQEALQFKPGSVYSVSPDYDAIKEALYQAASENGVVMVFAFWYAEFNTAAITPSARGIVPVPTKSPVSRHAYIFIDWKTIGGTEYLVAQLSQGIGFGDGGLLYFSKEVVNTAFANPILNGLGTYIFRTVADTQTIEIGLYQQTITLLKEILSLVTPKSGSISPRQLSTILTPLMGPLKWLVVYLSDMEPTPTNASPETPDVTQTPVVSDGSPVDLLTPFLAAIQEYEGWGAPGSTINGVNYPEGTPAYRNNNPGNIRCSAIMNALASGCDASGFCVFRTYAQGLQALKTGVTNVANGTSTVYNQNAKRYYNLASCADLTIRQFFAIRDPSSDNNDPDAYSNFVGKKLDVDPSTYQIKSLIA